MTVNGLAEPIAVRDRLNTEILVDGSIALARFFRPSDGWIAFLFLAMNLWVVIFSVEQAEWVVGLKLTTLLSLSIITGLLLHRIPAWGFLILPIGAALGLLAIVWQFTSREIGEVTVTNAAQLWLRLGLWVEAARTGSINIDTVPFAFGLMVITWTSGFLATWVFFRYRNFWGVFVLGGSGLVSNLTYLPPQASVHLALWLFTGLLLVSRVQSVRRRQEWEKRNVTYDGHLGILSFSDNFILALVVLIVAFLLPTGGKFGPTNDLYEFFRTPVTSFEDDFNRLFAGLPARRPLGYRIWGDVLAFQGTINPAPTQVLWVDSPVPLYWKARTYGTYTPKGWISDETVLRPVGWSPPVSSSQPYESRFEVNYSVTPQYDSKTLFASEQVVGVGRDVQIETYESPNYTLDFTEADVAEGHPEPVVQAASSLRRSLSQREAPATDSSLAARLPDQFRLVDVSRSNDGLIEEVVVADVLPEQPDILSVRSPNRNVKRGDTYEMASSVSLATADQLRDAGTNYPSWVLKKYTQLPDTLPQRVRDLSERLTADAETPYDKAKAIEEYLRSLPYTLSVDPPPFDADGVDHFLFTLEQGYSEYFASAMTVMLRTVDVPARMATGYTQGAKVPDENLYMVLDNNAHGWLEVYFPRYGWIAQEPTPGRPLPRPVPPEIQTGGESSEAPSETILEDECEDDDFEDCDAGLIQPQGGDGTPDATVFGANLTTIIYWLAGIFGAAIVAISLVKLLWGRYMNPSEDPRLAYRRLAFLGRLASVGPISNQTPHQYRQRLTQLLPDHREQLSVVVDSYVRARYGQRQLNDDQRADLSQAWIKLRMPLLMLSLRRRST
ncbi:MAG: transglutaminase domain-containing protein [Chloroflexota bacterium]|nr:transglutaminase domain-containing protein [Chloroflexota bacterium]